MHDLGLHLVDGLLAVARAEDADKAVIHDFFEKRLEGNNQQVLASHVLDTVLTHIKDHELVTDLQRQVLTNLAVALHEGVPGACNHGPPAPAQSSSSVDEGNDEDEDDRDEWGPKVKRSSSSLGSFKRKAAALRDSVNDNKMRRISAWDLPLPSTRKEAPVKLKQDAINRKKFLRQMMEEVEKDATRAANPEWYAAEEEPSPTYTQKLERRRASSTKSTDEDNVWVSKQDDKKVEDPYSHLW
ncbi:hypothetical protein F4805DRAFT_458553 [Annulohypoxylon moriforme]|nr:hypothetical protein F4805DRAFT_458553 [Annulohypoxylon moriforme]